MTDESDQEIVRRILSGDKNSYAILVRRYQHEVYKLSLGILRHPADAEDAVSDSLIKAFTFLTGGSGGDITSFKAWLLKITSRCCLDILRKRQRQQKHSAGMAVEDIPDAETPVGRILQEEQNKALWLALGRLNEEDRTAIIMKYYSGASYRDISQTLGWPPGTVASRLYRAREKLRNNLEKNYTKHGGDDFL